MSSTSSPEPEALVEDRATRRKRRQRKSRSTLLLVAGTALVVLLGGFAAFRAASPVGAATTTSSLGRHLTVNGSPPSASWPAEGQAAYAIPTFGVSAHSSTQASAPMGSIAKLMTALVVLRDYPLAPGSDGPSITVSPLDVVAATAELSTDQSNVAITAGETLTERQLLQGLLVHSGNDYAFLLAELDAGSVPQFLVKMNARAAEMRLSSTTYDDASGFSPKTVSTPSNQLIVGEEAMSSPFIASTVGLTAVTLPVAGAMGTYTPFAGTNDVVGVKSGLTTEAGGCDLLALKATVAGRDILVSSAVFGQMTGNRLLKAGLVALQLAREAAAAIVSVPISDPGHPVGTIGWSSSSSPLIAGATAAIPGWPGQRVVTDVTTAHSVVGSLPAGARAGTLIARSGRLVATWPLLTTRPINPPGLLDRVV